MTMVRPISRRAEVCRGLVRERRMVTDILGIALCANPVWDMLLDLYLARQEGRSVYVWALCLAANIPMSSAHRRVAALIEGGVLRRVDETGDRRRIGVALAPEVEAKLDHLMDRLAVRIEAPGPA